MTKTATTPDTTPDAGSLDTAGRAPAATDAKRATPRRSAADRLRWKAVGEDDSRTGRITATVGDVTYAVKPSKDGWQATKRQDGKTVVLVSDVSRTKAYATCVRTHHGDLPAVAAAS